jgi:hypothetical protein
LLESNPPSEVSTLLNLSLFKLMLAMYVLVLFSVGEWEFPWGQRDCWLVCWLAFGDLSLGLETLEVTLEVAAAAAATSDYSVTAILVQW